MSLRRPMVAYLLFAFVKALSVMSLRRPTVAYLLFTFVASPVYDVAQTSDCGISFKALYVMSPRRPTVAFLFSPLCGVAKTPDSGISFKPFMWCFLDVRLRHVFYLFTFRGVAPDTRSVFSHLFYLSSPAILFLLYEHHHLFMTHSCIH